MDTRSKEVIVIKPTKAQSKEDRLRVAAYCRVSTDSSDQLNSFFAQMKYYTDYIRSHDNMVLVDIYADEGITGTSIQKREEFKRLIRDCKNKRIDRLLVKSVTRFARNSLECIETVRQLKSCGVSVFFENDNIDTDKMDSEMILYIKSAFAQGEAMSASKRMTTSVRMKMESGTYVTPTAPFGYRLVEGKLVVEPMEAEIVRNIFKMYLDGFGVVNISLYLRENYPEYHWNKEGIRYILTNEKYIGDSLWQKYYTPTILPLATKRNKGEVAKYYCEGTHEPIIDKETFEKVRLFMMEKREKYYLADSITAEKSFNWDIKCRCCGWKFRARKRNFDVTWILNTLQKELSNIYSGKATASRINELSLRLLKVVEDANENLDEILFFADDFEGGSSYSKIFASIMAVVLKILTVNKENAQRLFDFFQHCANADVYHALIGEFCVFLTDEQKSRYNYVSAFLWLSYSLLTNDIY